MQAEPITLKEKLKLFSEHWSPKVVAELNDYQVKLVKFEGEFVWHQHDETDELFLCLHGSFDLQFRDNMITLREGDLYVVPKGVEHRPVANQECHALVLEPRGVVNTGEAESDFRAPNDEWI